MNSLGDEIEDFDIFKLAKNPECFSIFSLVLTNLEIYNFDINSQDEIGNTLLHLTIEYYQDRNNLVEQLITDGADVNKLNNMNESPLYIACCLENKKLMELLLEKGANLHIQDSKLKSMLHVAVEKENLELCKFLIDRGIDVNCQDHNGSTPLHYAVDLKLTKITFLLVHKADINKHDYDGYTPLHVASKTSVEQVKFLIRNKASNDAKTFNGDLPLHLAASSGNLEAVIVLLNEESSTNVLNNDNYSPVKLAEINGHEEVRQFLLRNCNSGGPPSKIPKAAKARKPHGNVNSRNRALNKPKLTP